MLNEQTSLTALVGANIVQKRKLRGLTQEQLAEMVGIGQQSLSRMEQGRIAPRFGRLQALANALGCSVPDIFRSPDSKMEERASTMMDILGPLSAKSQEALLNVVITMAYAMKIAEGRCQDERPPASDIRNRKAVTTDG